MSIEILTQQILKKMSRIGHWQYSFLLHLLPLWVAMRGRYNFHHLSRWGGLDESTYRSNFQKGFDWLDFTSSLAQEVLSTDLCLAFDPSYLPKSGKHTAGVGYFYSGCAQRALRGLEISGIAAIDQQNKMALHLEAIQTIDLKENETLLDYYSRLLIERKERLQALSKVVLADAFFSKRPFVEALTGQGFELITRLRSDACLRYLYSGPQKKGRGRPKVYDGRIDPKNLREELVRPCAQDKEQGWIAYEVVANVRAWKRNAKLIIVHDLKDGQIKNVRIYACTDLSISGAEALFAYHSRFQIEFLYRDAKQYAGLTHCQARSKEKIHFHINTSLTAVSLAKVDDYINQGKPELFVFSMANVNTLYANNLILDKFISWSGITPKPDKIKQIRQYANELGRIAA